MHLKTCCVLLYSVELCFLWWEGGREGGAPIQIVKPDIVRPDPALLCFCEALRTASWNTSQSKDEPLPVLRFTVQ